MLEKIKEAKKIYEALIVLGILLMPIGFIIFLNFAYKLEGSIAFLVGIASTLSSLYLIFTFTKKIKKLSNEFKQKYIYEELSKIFPNSTYEYDKGFSQDEVTDSGLLQYHTKYLSEDMITGTFKGVLFRCSDVLQQEIYAAGKTVITKTVFKGRYMNFPFLKNSNIIF